jgi:ribosomal-protein-alanine N-acetyltransferase
MNHLLKDFKLLNRSFTKRFKSSRTVPVFTNQPLWVQQKKFLLCRALITDIPEMLALRQEVFPAEAAWNAAVFAKELKNTKQKLYLLLRFNDSLAAFIGLDFYPKKQQLHITSLAVALQFQHQGLGTSLLTFVKQLGEENGYRSINLEVRKSNLIAQKLYDHLGFVSTGKIKNYYQTNNETALIMKYSIKKETHQDAKKR